MTLAFKIWRRVRRYGLLKTMKKTRQYLRRRLGWSDPGGHWDEEILEAATLHVRHWYQSPLIQETVRGRICPKPAHGPHLGLATWLERQQGQRVFERALSIGCGLAAREIDLLVSGRVKRFVCFELGARLIAAAQASAEAHGVAERIEFRNVDAFSHLGPEEYDLVFWHHSLHHMFDVDRAVRVSREVLQEDGVFLADEYVGPSRFQWTDANLELMNSFRAQLPPRFFVRPDFPEESYPRTVSRPTPEQVMRVDPSEAVQSEEILRSVVKWFPNAEIRLTGGAAYHIGLQEIIGNFDESNDVDRAILKEILEIDRMAVQNPAIGTHFAAIFAEKR